MERHGYSKNKISGIVKRAEDKGIIIKVKRGVYKINEDIQRVGKYSTDRLIRMEVLKTIKNIEGIVASNFTEMDVNSMMRAKETIEKLKSIIIK